VDDLGLPTSRVDLPVRAQGWLLGHFVLTPTPGRRVESERVVTAVAIADLVGGVILADESDPVGVSGRTGLPGSDGAGGSGD
jgi:hypothetical protein